jgi:hypothetical protein
MADARFGTGIVKRGRPRKVHSVKSKAGSRAMSLKMAKVRAHKKHSGSALHPAGY